MSRKKKETAPITLFSFQDIITCLLGVMVIVALLIALDGLSAEERVEAKQVSSDPSATATAELQEQSEQMKKEVEALKQELAARKSGAAVTEEEVRVMELRVRQMAGEVDRFQLRLDDLAKQRAAQDSTLAERARQADALKEEIAQGQIKARRARVQFRPGALESLAPLFVEVGAQDMRIGVLDPQRVPILEQTLASGSTNEQVLAALGDRTPATHYAVLVVHDNTIKRFEALREAFYRRGYEVGWQLWDNKSGGAFLEALPTAQGVTP